MNTPRNIPSWAYAVAVVLTTVAYGASYVVIKDAMEAVATSWLLAMRFGLAALVLGVAFWRRIARTIDLSHVLAGVVVGLPEALGFLLQNLGLTQTSPGRNAFLTATYCVMVPFLGWAVALEPAPATSAFTAEFAAQLAYITIATTVVGLLVQNVAQRHLPSSQVALLLSFESVFAAVFSVAFYGEKITPSLLAGFALIFGAVLVSQFAPDRRQADKLRAEARRGRL